MKIDRKEQLKQALMSLELGMTPEDVESRLEKLGDKEIELLLPRTKELQEYLIRTSNKANEVSPEKYKELNNQYEKEMQGIDNEYAKNMEKIDKDTVQKLDQLAEEELKASESIIEEEGQMLQNITSISQKMSEKMTKAV